MIAKNPSAGNRAALDLYLKFSDVVDFHHPEVAHLVENLSAAGAAATYAERCFRWVRDEVTHSADTQIDVVSCSASEILQSRVGLCYAKSHLLVALLRAGGVPSGFSYQRLTTDAAHRPYCLHGLVSVFLPELGWYRVDPRGGERGALARFSPPRESLVYATAEPGEYDLPGVYAEPLDVVIKALRAQSSMSQLLQNLPDAAA